MKTELRLRPHHYRDNANVIEIWHDGQFIGEVTGADEPGIKVITKHKIPTAGVVEGGVINIAEVRIEYK